MLIDMKSCRSELQARLDVTTRAVILDKIGSFLFASAKWELDDR